MSGYQATLIENCKLRPVTWPH